MNFYARMAVLAVFTAASISCSKEGVEREIPAGNSPIVINELASGVPGELMIKIRCYCKVSAELVLLYHLH